MMKQFQLDALSRGVTSVFVWSDHVAVNFYKKFDAEMDGEWINGKLRFEE